jgi:HK97 family phage major capsid protein
MEELKAQLAALELKMSGQLDEKTKKEVEAQLKSVKDQLDALKDAKQEITDLKESVRIVKDASEKQAEEIRELKAANGRLTQQAEEKGKTFGDIVKKSIEDNSDNVEKFIRGERKSFALEMNVKAVADFSTGNVTGGTVYGAQYRNGIIVNPNQIGHMRNALPVLAGDASATDYYFMREDGVGEGAPAPTAEKKATAATTVGTGLKPSFDMDLVESSVKYETIAGIMPASKKSLRTIPSILNFINLRVPEKLLDVEDAQILYGDGSTPNIKGILTSGNFVAGSAAGTTPLAEKILDDISLLEDTHKRMAAAIWMRPVDFYSFFKNKADGSGEYDLPQGVTFVNGQLLLWGIPVFKTTALTTNDYVIGAAGGAEILQSEAIRVEFFEQDGTNVRTNQVTIRVEETIALPVYGSNYFVKGSSATV